MRNLHITSLLALAQLAVVASQPVIGEISKMEEKDKDVKWGSRWMGDHQAYEADVYPGAPRDTSPPEYYAFTPRSPNDPGLANLPPTENRERKFMKEFGYVLSDWVRDEPLTASEALLLQWVESEGLQSPCATIAHFKHPNFSNHTITGLLANCTILANRDAIRVPTTLVVTPHRLESTPGFDRIAENLKLERSISFDYDHILLTLFVALESQNQASFWYPYLNTLPREVKVPTESDQYGLLFFDASVVPNNTAHRHKAMDWQFDHLSQFFQQHPSLLPKFRHFNRQVFDWAYAVVTSRSFRLDFGVHKDALCLVPFADLMNHRPNTPVGWLFQSKTSLAFYVGSEVRYGEQIFNNYGNLGNEFLVQDFGFVARDNPYTCAHVFLPSPPSGDPFLTQREGLLKTKEIAFGDPLCVRMGPPSSELLFAALVLSMDGDKLPTNLSPENFVTFLDDDLFERVYAMLGQAARERLAAYKYTTQLDERLLPLVQESANARPSDATAVRRYNAVSLRYEEKVILQSLLDFLNVTAGYKCARLPTTYQGANDAAFLVRADRTCSRYARRVMIQLLSDVSWENSNKHVRERQLKGPYENWDFSQDGTVFPRDGHPVPIGQAWDAAANAGANNDKASER